MVIVPVVNVSKVIMVDALADTNVTLGPPVFGGYTCSPTLPQGELNEYGELIIPAESADESTNGAYVCTSQYINGSITMQINVFG